MSAPEPEHNAETVRCPDCGMELVTAPARPEFGLAESVLHKGKVFRTSLCPARRYPLLDPLENDGGEHGDA